MAQQLTVGELVLRRRLDKSEQLGRQIYHAGQYQAVILGDEAIITWVDGFGNACQLFCHYRDKEWMPKVGNLLVASDRHIELRQWPLQQPLHEAAMRAIQSAEAAREKKTKEKAEKKAQKENQGGNTQQGAAGANPDDPPATD